MDTNKMRDLKAMAEAAGSDEWYAAGDLRYCDDKTGETHGLHHDDSRFIAAASPATVLALLEEIERLESAKGDPIGSFDKHMEYMQENIRLKADNEALRKQIADLWPLKNVPPQDFRASNKCLACGEYHHGLSGLPCPKMTPVAQAFAGVNQRVVPVEPLRIPHPLEAMAKEASHG
ncbi:ead/Ea22-like family protein [Pseudomonas sp. BYT-5]|uniref:ead/Ea22-like family protein n=1 Tax=unclassified Pseudomonas TaxID=196821 RepID=UPI0020218DFA|nr:MULTISPECIES: ead/Ea22-like family protein [unclassified Pseudomonas]URD44540.1 ead/Ea22-like family protein [Pseudomonas sp. BYT-5]URK99866.1 ead/Ea22-like family protein [Pseudomonas sp. BYT-1]